MLLFIKCILKVITCIPSITKQANIIIRQLKVNDLDSSKKPKSAKKRNFQEATIKF